MISYVLFRRAVYYHELKILMSTIALIWFLISLPLPWAINNPIVSESSLYTMLGIIGIMSIPFIALGVAWTLKPELTT